MYAAEHRRFGCFEGCGVRVMNGARNEWEVWMIDASSYHGKAQR